MAQDTAQDYEVGRYEFKYVLPTSDRARILEVSAPYVLPDPHAVELPSGLMGYEVHSLYFDTPDLRDYYERLESRRVRNRLRIRTYGRPGTKQPVFLENKRKYTRWVVKSRVKVCDAIDWCTCPDPKPWAVFSRQVPPKKRYASDHFVRLMEDFQRRPVSVVHYEREVFIAQDPDQPKVRLTMDHQVHATVDPAVTDLYGGRDVDLLPPDWMVLELKFDNNRPGWMKTVCRELKLRAVPVSKFGLSVAKGVAGNKYREVRFFTPRQIRWTGWGL